MAASNSPTRQWILKPGPNALVFLFCTLLAAVFWLVKAMEEQYTTQIAFPIEYQSFPENRLLKDSLPTAATLKVRSKGWQLFKLQLKKDPYPLVVNLSDAADGHIVQLGEKAFFKSQQVPKKLDVLKVKPDTLKIAFDKAREKEVPVVLNGTFDYAKHHRLVDSISLAPATVRIRGPETYVEKIDQVKTQKFHYKQIKSKRIEEQPLQKPAYPFVDYSHTKIKVIIPAETVTEKSLELKVNFNNPYYRNRISLIPRDIKATFQVPLSHFTKVNAADFKAVVNDDLMDQPNPPSHLPVTISQKPNFIYNLRYHPKKVRFLIPQNPHE